MMDARERLLAFVERVEREHGGTIRPGCPICVQRNPCDAARAAAVIRAMAGHFGPESRAWSDTNVQVLMRVGADALEE